MTAGYTAESELEKYFSQFAKHRLQKHQPLLYQGEVPPMALFIKSGVVKMYDISPNGEEKIVGYEAHGSLLPLEWIFGRSPVSSYYYDTFTECELYRISRDDLMEVINTNPELTGALMSRFVSMYLGANIHLHALEQSKARNKVLYIFQYLVMRFGESIDKTNYRINLRLTHQDIANLIGSTRETASSEIGKLSKEGIVRTKDLKYIVDTDKAVRVLGEAYFAELDL